MFSSNKKLLLLVMVNICMFIYFYYFSSIFPLFMDDYVYTSEYWVSHSLDFSKLEKIYYSVKASLGWNARIGESFSYIFKFFHKVYFDIFISIINVVFINLVFFYSFLKLPNRYRDIFYLFTIFCLYIILQKTFYANSLWLDGSLVHLFGNTVLLLVFIPYFYLFYDKNIIKNKWITFLLVPFVYFISFMNSYTSVPLFLSMMFLAVAYFYYRNRHIYLWTIIGIIFSFFGFLYVLIFPNQTQAVEEGIFLRLIKRYYESLIIVNKELYINHILFLFTLLIFLFFILYLVYQKRYAIFKNESFIKIFIICSLYLGSITLYTVGPYIPERGLTLNRFLVLMFLIIILNILFVRLRINIIKYCLIGVFSLILLILLVGKTIYHNEKIIEVRNDWERIADLVKEAKSYSENVKIVILTKKEIGLSVSAGCLIHGYSWCGASIIRYYGGNPNNIIFKIGNENRILLEKL